MTSPFQTEKEWRAPVSHPNLSEALHLIPLPGISQPSQQRTMFMPTKFSRFEVLPPVLCTRRLYVQLAFFLLIVLILFMIRMMSAMRGTFVQYHLKSNVDGDLVILPAEFAQMRGAFCLDGSPPAYYYRPSIIPAFNFWIIHLQVGGWCTTGVDCFERSNTALGSSLKTGMSQPLEGIMSSDCNINPDFCKWNIVDLLYCDGGSYLGNRSDPVIVNSKLLYLRGALVLDSLIEHLTSFTALKDAQQVIMAGSSAGSLGALIHANRLRKQYLSHVKTVHVLVDGGLFVDVADVNNINTMANILKDAFHFHHMGNAVSMKECTHKSSKGNEWRCLFPGVFHKYVFTPVFFINSLYDTWFRRYALKLNCSLELCPDRNLQQVISTRVKLFNETQQILQSAKNGVFLTSCPAHTMLWKKSFSTIISQAYPLQKGLGAWFNHKDSGRNFTEVLEVADALRTCSSLKW